MHFGEVAAEICLRRSRKELQHGGSHARVPCHGDRHLELNRPALRGGQLFGTNGRRELQKARALFWGKRLELFAAQSTTTNALQGTDPFSSNVGLLVDLHSGSMALWLLHWPIIPSPLKVSNFGGLRRRQSSPDKANPPIWAFLSQTQFLMSLGSKKPGQIREGELDRK